MSAIQGLISALGRIMLVGIFLMSAVANKIPQFNAVVEKMTEEGIPNARYMLMGAIAFLIIGSLSVMLGYKARVGALLLAVFLGMATYYFHDFWTFAQDSTEFKTEMGNFIKNSSIMGALFFIIANGSGAGSVDRRKVTIVV
ncbi:MAG: DoxX family protein [Planctomycetia bacterium]|nr:DoxX family protein [Planctomycetia bacterium]